MRPLTDLLALVPSLYVDLEDAALPTRSGEPSDRARDPREKPAPGRLDVMEHRALLVRGLRWWVDAVRETGQHTKVGHSVPLMAEWLAAHLDDMAPEDYATLRSDLHHWVYQAWRITDPTPPEKGQFFELPVDAYARRVRVADAAEILGCTVRTIQRRVPAERRQGGMVLLADAAERCGQCDLIVGQCPHTRATPVAH